MIGSLLFLMLCVGLTVVAFYLGFIRKAPREPEFFKGRAQGGFVAFSVISLICMWHIWNLTQMEPQLPKYVEPYPGAKYTVSSYGSFVDDDARWLATVDAPPDTVMNFYLSPKNVPGWTIAEENDYALVFRKEDAQLSIFVTNEGRGSMITYTLTKQK